MAVAGSPAMQAVLSRLPAACQYGAGLLGVLASEAAWDSGDDWLDALIRQLDHVRAEFGRLLAERLPRARYVPPEASYLAWVDCAELDLGPSRPRCSCAGAGWRWAGGWTSARRATASSG